MNQIAVHKVKNLHANAKDVVEQLLGRKLKEEDEVTLLVFPPHPAPPATVRKAALARAGKILDKAAKNMKNVPPPEFDAAVHEAMRHVRRRKP